MSNWVEYHGTAGVSQWAQEAVQLLFMRDLRLKRAIMLTEGYHHSFVFVVGTPGDDQLVAIKSGFASGYVGAGSRALAVVLSLIDTFDVPAAEIKVPEGLLARLDESALTDQDLKIIQGAPTREYVPLAQDVFGDRHSNSTPSPWFQAPRVMPASILDPRLHDLAAKLWTDPDGSLFKAFRRLEDIVRKRTGLQTRGSALFSAAFQRDNAPLHWPELDASEQTARTNLFCGAFGAYRNPHAHNERERAMGEYLSEFLVVNELFRLERQAVSVKEGPDHEATQQGVPADPSPSARGG